MSSHANDNTANAGSDGTQRRKQTDGKRKRNIARRIEQSQGAGRRVLEHLKASPDTHVPQGHAGEAASGEATGKSENRSAVHTGTGATANCIAAFQHWLHLPDPSPLYAVLATVAANRLDGDPVWLMLVGASGAGKTELLQPLAALSGVHLAAGITVPGLLSGTRKAEQDEAATGGLLHHIGDSGLLILKDFTSILSMHPAQRTELLAAFREIYDGHWTRHLGSDGGKTLEWRGRLGLIAGCTEAIDTHHAVMAAMGERFCQYRLPPVDAEAQARRALAGTGTESAMRTELAAAVRQLFASLDLAAPGDSLSAADEGRLVALATLAARCRSAVERDPYSREIIQIYQPESPARLAKVLARLRIGLLALGVDPDLAWTILTKIGLDCMPTLRRLAFDLLIAQPAGSPAMSTEAVAAALGYQQGTVRRALQDLAAQHVLHESRGGESGKAAEWAVTEWIQAIHATATGSP
jgi:hypothetical protein